MKIGILNNPLRSVYDEATFCGEAGFDFLDLTLEGPNACTVDIARMQPILNSHGLSVIGHTDPCLPYAYPIQGVRQACLRELERCAEIFSALGAKLMNIHPCYACPPGLKKDLLKFNIEAILAIVEMASSYDLTVVFENYVAPFDRVSTLRTLLTAVPGLQLHLDFGHVNFGHDGHERLCRELGKDIRHVHFSDNRGKTDDHMPLGAGTMDLRKTVDSLKTAGYDDTITLEIFCSDQTMRSHYLEMNRKLLVELWDLPGGG